MKVRENVLNLSLLVFHYIKATKFRHNHYGWTIPERKREILANAFQRIAALTFPEKDTLFLQLLFTDEETLKFTK